MSTRSFNRLWNETQSKYDEILEKEFPRVKSAKSDKGHKNFSTLSTMYVEYIRIMQNLETCYDQMIHPQKRITIRKLLDGTMGRIVELRHEMIAIELREALNFDEVLTELHLTHDDIAIPIPRYFLQERAAELQERSQLMDEITSRFGLSDQKMGGPIIASQEDAIKLIQRMERARQGRISARQMQDIHARLQREKQPGVSGKGAKEGNAALAQLDSNVAALKIQQMWKGYATWKKIQTDREAEMIFLGMIPPQLPSDPTLFPQYHVQQTENFRRDIRSRNEKMYEDTRIRIKSEVLQEEGFLIMDGLRGEIREWFHNMKTDTGKFPDYPSDDEGGYEAALAAAPELLKEANKDKKDSKKTKSPIATSGRKPSEAKQISSTETSTISRGQASSAFLPAITEACRDYKETWNKLPLPNEIEESFNETLIVQEKRAETLKELRVQVDALMRQELERLKIAMLRDKGKRGKKLRAALKKKKKKKKPKVPKKKRKERDLTPHRPLDFLLDELVREGIVRKYPKVKITDFIGEAHYLRPDIKKQTNVIAPPLSLEGIRRLVTEYCILPLGSTVVHERSPQVKSILLCGPARTGKTMLANAICAEAGATLFDLSASNLVGKYPGREGLKMLMHLVSKVGRLLQPSVVLIEDADKMFLKKLPKIEKTDPKRIKKGLHKLIKGLCEEDRILVVGTCRMPFESDMKGLGAAYNKIIVIGKPDHASRYAIWKQLIQINGGKITSALDISSLTKLSDGFSTGSIALTISQIMTPHRVALQRRRTLTANEFFGPLSKYEPIYKEEEAAFDEWYKRTPLVRKKITSLEPPDTKAVRDKGKEKAKDSQSNDKSTADKSKKQGKKKKK